MGSLDAPRVEFMRTFVIAEYPHEAARLSWACTWHPGARHLGVALHKTENHEELTHYAQVYLALVETRSQVGLRKPSLPPGNRT